MINKHFSNLSLNLKLYLQPITIHNVAKNKKNPAKLQVHLSEDNYLKTGKARNLSIKKCLINADWQDAGIASIVVVRQMAILP